MSRGSFLVAAAALLGPASVLTAAPEGMVLIPGGVFEMGCHVPPIPHPELCPSDQVPVHKVLIDAFYMDIYEVTNEQYAEALNWAITQEPPLVDDPSTHSGTVLGSGDGRPYCRTTTSDPQSRITWNGSTFGVVSGKENHPMLLVTWYGAVAYANWRSEQEGRTPCYTDAINWECDFGADGYRLPTESEWEYAARGGKHDPYCRYPWGNDPDGTKANYAGSGDPFECGGGPTTTPVGFYNGCLHQKVDFGWPCTEDSFQTSDGTNGYGLYDMGGNVWEYCNDWKDDYPVCEPTPCENPHGPPTSPDNYRAHRGGGWFGSAEVYPIAHRGEAFPHQWMNNAGLRLVLADPRGACWLPSNACVTHLTEEECGLMAGTYEGDGTRCECPDEPAVPAVSEWGLVTMTLLLLIVGTLVFAWRRAAQA